jgi:hypothetical protein
VNSRTNREGANTRRGTKNELFAFVFLFAVVLAGCSSTPTEDRVDREALAAQARATLDDFHAAAAAADEKRYFGHFAADGVFLGTDASERWPVEAFRAYAKPHFDKGKGWTYHATDRHVAVDGAGTYAWFDELLENAKLGVCRGSGVLRREQGEWRVVLYDLSIPIPNALADDFAAQIKKAAPGK